MHRVELKENMASQLSEILQRTVPNAPCGVEREEIEEIKRIWEEVPNAPCGVESQASLSSKPTVWDAFFLLSF